MLLIVNCELPVHRPIYMVRMTVSVVELLLVAFALVREHLAEVCALGVSLAGDEGGWDSHTF